MAGDILKKKGYAYLLIFLGLYISAVCASAASAFTANTVGDHGNVTVMEVTGNYDAKNPDGTLNGEARQIIAKEFYRCYYDIRGNAMWWGGGVVFVNAYYPIGQTCVGY